MSYQAKIDAKLIALGKEFDRKASAIMVERKVVLELLEMGLPEPSSVCVHDGNHVSVTIKVPKVEGEYRDYTGACPVKSALLLAKLTSASLIKMDPASDGSCLSLYPAEARAGREKFVSEGTQYEVSLRQKLFGEIAGSYDLRYTNFEITWWTMSAGRVVEITVPVNGVAREYVVTKIRNGSTRGFTKPHIPGSKQIAFGGGTGIDVSYLFATIDDALESLAPAKEVA